jgi:Invasin, domain 3/Bacterial Ig-like domain (group 1)
MQGLFLNQKTARFLLATAIAVLAGCTGNPTGTTPATSGTPGTPATIGTAALTVTLFPSNSITAAASAAVTATLKDASGAAMANQVVTFSTDGTLGTLSQATALTNGSGIAIVNLSQAANATPGATYVTASAQGLTASAGYSVGGGGGGGGGVTVGSVSVTATPASVTADGFTLITIKATVLDAASAPISNQAVTFTTASGTLSSSTATTNASGVAQVFLTASTKVGSANVVAYTGGVPASVLVSFAAGLPANVALSTTATSVAALGTTTVVAALTDYNNNKVGAGQTVTFGTSSATGGHFTDLAGVAATSATTDALGVARMLYVAGTCTGSCTDFLTANATNAAMTTTYATNLAQLSVGGSAGTPTLTISTITSPISSPVTVTVTLLDVTATAVPNAVVTFSITNPTLGTLTPSNGTALTNASGKATITLTPTTLSSGATYLNASAQVGTAAVSASSGFSVGAASVTLTPVTFGIGAAPTWGPLSAFGTTSMSTLVCIGSGAATGGCTAGSPVTTSMTVNFTSVCASSGKAVISSSATTLGGVATGSYRDNGCAGTDTVTATVPGVASVSASLSVSAPNAGSIQYVSASPTLISLRGTGGTTTSQVVFKVVDGGGNPVSGKAVYFGLNTTLGGITLTPAITSTPTTVTSGGSGLVVANVNAGTFSTAVRVTATTCTTGFVTPLTATPTCTGAGTILTTQSSQLIISTGIPAQDAFSLSATTHNIEGWAYDGVTTVITARVADHFHNPVPDGTAVYFTTEGGSIGTTSQSCTTVNGSCQTTLTSQAPRPASANNGYGRVTVSATAVGEEAFIDLNSNGTVDGANEMIDINGHSTDIGYAYRDDNENGVYDPSTEPYIDFNNSGSYTSSGEVNMGGSIFGSTFAGAAQTPTAPLSYAGAPAQGDGWYHGVLCTVGAAICSPMKSIDVRDSQVIIFSTSSPASYAGLAFAAANTTPIVDTTPAQITAIDSTAATDLATYNTAIATYNTAGSAYNTALIPLTTTYNTNIAACGSPAPPACMNTALNTYNASKAALTTTLNTAVDAYNAAVVAYNLALPIQAPPIPKGLRNGISAPGIVLSSCWTVANATGNTPSFITVTVVDGNGNAMPAGTTISFATDQGTKVTPSSWVVPDTIGCRSGFPGCPASAASPTFGDIQVSLISDATYTAGTAGPPATPGTCTNPQSGGVFTVTVTTPGVAPAAKTITTYTMGITD